MHSHLFRFVELITLFIALPLLLAFNPIWQISIVSVLLGGSYVIWLAVSEYPRGKVEFFSSHFFKSITDCFRSLFFQSEFRRVILMFLVYALITVIFIHIYLPEKLFHPINNNVFLWIGITALYALLSVIPQEWLFRVFFFKRYSMLFRYQWLLILINGFVFSLAHLMFFNVLVMVLTFCGGLLFAYTYQKTKSFGLICTEHFLYGWWLYHAGLGEMLAFPSG